MHAGGRLLDVGLGRVVVVHLAQEAGVDVRAEVEGLAVEGGVGGAQLGALAGRHHALVDGRRVGQHRQPGELLEVGRVVPCTVFFGFICLFNVFIY